MTRLAHDQGLPAMVEASALYMNRFACRLVDEVAAKLVTSQLGAEQLAGYPRPPR